MANPIIPGIPQTEQDLLYSKLNAYNQGRASYKEVGAYLIVLPRPEYLQYTLWIYSPLPGRQSIFYICDLSTDIHETLRMASTLCFYSPRSLLLVEYNAKRMQSKGDDIISIGKYHGHFLHEILRIDPAYLTWIAFKFQPRIPKQERFVQIAKIYHSVHLDIQRRKTYQTTGGRFLGKEGEKSGEPDTDRTQRATGRQPLQDAAQRDHSLFLCTPSVETERLHRQLRQHPAECTHGKPEIMPAARRGTCLPDGRSNEDSIGTHRAYLYNRKYEIHPIDTCKVTRPYRVKDFLSDTNHTLHTAAFPGCLNQADDSDHLAGIALQRFAVVDMPIDILIKSCIITGKTWIGFSELCKALHNSLYVKTCVM